MIRQSTKKTSCRKITLAVFTGLVSGAARSIIAWALNHLMP